MTKPTVAISLAGLWDGAGHLLRLHLLSSIETKQRVLENWEADILAAAAMITGLLARQLKVVAVAELR